MPISRGRFACVGSRGGFTLVEIVVAVLIAIIMAAVLIPVVTGRIAQGQASALGQTMDAVSRAVAEYRVDVRRYPTRLQQLTSVPPAGTRDPCGRTVPAAFLENWRGPYLPRELTAAGLPVGDALVLDTLASDPATFTTTTVGFLLIETEGVDRDAAETLEDAFDGDGNLAGGVVRWTEVAGDRGTLEFGIRIRGC